MKKILFMLGNCLFFTVLLSACGSNSGNTPTTSSYPKTAQATSTQTVTTTTQAALSTSTPQTKTSTSSSQASTNSSNTSSCNTTYGCGVGSSNLTLYHGSGYSIDYPGSWAIKSDGSSGQIFSTPDEASSFHVFVGTTSTSPLQYEFGTLAQNNCKAVVGVASTVQINGISWKQSQFTCTSGDGSGKVQQIGILTSTSAHNNTYYSADYMTSSQNFSTVYQTFFKPMAASFKLQ